MRTESRTEMKMRLLTRVCTVRKRSKISPRGFHYSQRTQIVVSEIDARGGGIHQTPSYICGCISGSITVERSKLSETHVMATRRTMMVLLVCLAAASALPAEEAQRALHTRNSIQTENDLMDSIYSDCLRKDSMSCIKYKLFSFVDKMLGQKDTFTLTEGVTVVKTSTDPQDGAPRTLSGDETVESLIVKRVQRYLDTHTLKVDLKGSDVVNAVSSTGRALLDAAETFGDDTEEARGKKKKAAKLLGPIMAALALKAAALIPLALGAIALIAGKALLIGKIALVLSAIIGLKKLFGGQGKHVTYEVVSHPHHSSSHVSSHDSYGGGFGGAEVGGGASAGYSAGGSGGTSGHGSWGRSLESGQQLAYNAHVPSTQQ